MSGLTKSREAYLLVLAQWRKSYDAALVKWQAEGSQPATRPLDVETLLQSDDAHVLKTIAVFPKEQQKPLLELWALGRASADSQNWSSEWRKAKSFSHGVVGGTFVGLFGNHLKAAIAGRLDGLGVGSDMAYNASLAYHRQVDNALALDEGTLKVAGFVTGIASQIFLPMAAAGSATNVASTATFTALQGPVYLVPLATTRIGNIARFGAVDAAAYGTVGYALHDGNHYRTVDGAVDGGTYGIIIGSIVPKAARGLRSAVQCTVDDVAAPAATLPRAPAATTELRK